MVAGWRYRQLRAQGLTEGAIRWQAEQGGLQRPYQGMYLNGPAGLTEHDRLRALLTYAPHAAAAAQSAARLHGFGDVPPQTVPTIVIPAGAARPRLRGVRVLTTTVAFEPVQVAGIACLPAARCAVDLARTSRRLDALPVLDSALRAAACTPEELVAEVVRHRELRGVRQARELIRYADPGAQCRQESQLRLVALDAQLPPPRTQLPVSDGFDRVRYLLDIGWEERRVGAEYDGLSHLDRARMRHDRERHNWLAARGWRMRYFTDIDLYRRPRYVVAVLREALALPR